MKNIVTFAIVSIALASITACNQKTYTADYLLTDKAKRLEILEECKMNKQSTENCNNANQAQETISLQINAKKRQIQTLEAKEQILAYNRAKYPNALPSVKQRSEQQSKHISEQINKLNNEIGELEKK